MSLPDAVQKLSDEELYFEYQLAKEDGPQLRLDDLQLEIAQRWEAELEDEHGGTVVLPPTSSLDGVPGCTYLIRNERPEHDESFLMATADERGIIRDDEGRAFGAGPYSKVEVVTEDGGDDSDE